MTAPECDRCGDELHEFGALLFSPPDTHSRVDKLHICVTCYDALLGEFQAWAGITGRPSDLPSAVDAAVKALGGAT